MSSSDSRRRVLRRPDGHSASCGDTTAWSVAAQTEPSFDAGQLGRSTRRNRHSPKKTYDGPATSVASLPPREAADYIQQLSYSDAAAIVIQLAPEKLFAVLSHASVPFVVGLATKLPPEDSLRILAVAVGKADCPWLLCSKERRLKLLCGLSSKERLELCTSLGSKDIAALVHGLPPLQVSKFTSSLPKRKKEATHRYLREAVETDP